MSILSRRTAIIGAVAIAVAAGGAFALTSTFGDFQEYEAAQVYANDGVAIDGTDPVSYFLNGAPVAGDPAITADWSGATWRFASAENRDLFLSDPAKYAPQYGGFCAWAVAERGKLFSTDPNAWKIVDGKLYLNFNQDIQKKWEADIPSFISEGDRRWPEISSES
ncbi:MAG: YHS domain-containing (seleno)protein [Pseudomonadota bacterium]